ncbi:MAG: phosphoadenosine phosphosulfate reductase [Gallionella sp.]|nr:phosphoadenosine phosphosulfate reductase [Gallionella sp.]
MTPFAEREAAPVAAQRIRSERNHAQMIVASFGGGVNSTAMLIGMHERGERVDLILFADTGGEKPHTYAHVLDMSEWLVNHGMPAIVTVSQQAETLESDCLKRKALPGIAYGFKSCSDHFKLRPQQKYLKAHGIVPTVKLIGFDASEPQRAKPVEGNRYPLIEWDWGREECAEAIDRAGITQPGKSSCFFCPSSTKPEIMLLRRQYPDLADRAVAMEKNAELTVVKGLGRRFAWGDLYAADDAQANLFPESHIEIDCCCYDGEPA